MWSEVWICNISQNWNAMLGEWSTLEENETENERNATQQHHHIGWRALLVASRVATCVLFGGFFLVRHQSRSWASWQASPSPCLQQHNSTPLSTLYLTMLLINTSISTLLSIEDSLSLNLLKSGYKKCTLQSGDDETEHVFSPLTYTVHWQSAVVSSQWMCARLGFASASPSLSESVPSMRKSCPFLPVIPLRALV